MCSEFSSAYKEANKVNPLPAKQNGDPTAGMIAHFYNKITKRKMLEQKKVIENTMGYLY